MMQTQNDAYLSLSCMVSLYQKILNTSSQNSLEQVKQQINYIMNSLRKSLSVINSDQTACGARLKKYLFSLSNQLSHIESMCKSLEEPFSIFIVGKGKFGKSTLINALLMDNKAEIDIVPKTWKIDVFKKGNETKGIIQAYSQDGSLLDQWDKVAHNYAEFQSMTRNMYNEINEGSHSNDFF